jgi:hypothetical protein
MSDDAPGPTPLRGAIREKARDPCQVTISGFPKGRRRRAKGGPSASPSDLSVPHKACPERDLPPSPTSRRLGDLRVFLGVT